MNIGLVVNARGKMCLVHDEEFEAVPLWVGYHVDRRQIEIIFDTGATFPIDWEAPDEMDKFLLKIKKILIIRMENKKPVEGYDTSFLRLQANRTIGVSLIFNSGMRGQDRFGQFSMEAGSVNHDRAPSRVVYDGIRRVLRLQWNGCEDYTLSFAAREHQAALLAYPFLRFCTKPRTQGGVPEITWVPIELSMMTTPRLGEPPEQVDQLLAWELRQHLSHSALSLGQAGEARDGEPTEWDASIIWRPLDKADRSRFWQAVNENYIVVPVSSRYETILSASLPWYRDVSIISHAQMVSDSYQQWVLLWQRTTGCVVPLDLKAATLRHANDKLGLELGLHNARSYLRFAQYFERERFNCLLYAESVSDLPWQEHVTEEDKRMVATHLQPISVTLWGGHHHAFLVTATAAHNQILSAVRVVLAFQACTLEQTEDGTPIVLQPGDARVIEAVELLSDLPIQRRSDPE